MFDGHFVSNLKNSIVYALYMMVWNFWTTLHVHGSFSISLTLVNDIKPTSFIADSICRGSIFRSFWSGQNTVYGPASVMDDPLWIYQGLKQTRTRWISRVNGLPSQFLEMNYYYWTVLYCKHVPSDFVPIPVRGEE